MRSAILLYSYRLLFAAVLLPGSFKIFAAPVPTNDDCAAATVIAIPNGGFSLGTFTSAQADLSQATTQAGETFAPAIFVAGQDKKSVWFKFSLATIRAVRVTLTQPGTTITAGDAGFAVYQSVNCLPTNAEISTKLTPIVTFGNTFHPCVPSAEYLVQVSSNFNANGPIIVQVEVTDQTGAVYDHPNQAYNFGTAGYYSRYVDFNTECLSIEDSSEICSAFSSSYEYNKSAWMTFKTPAYFDYLAIQLAHPQGNFPSQSQQYMGFGYHLYKGDARVTPIGSLVTVTGCDSLSTNGYWAGYRMYKCGELDTGTIYSIQVFFKKSFVDDVRLGIMTGGQQPTRAPRPILSDVPAPNAIGNLPGSPAGTYTYYDDVLACNSRHSSTNCGPALPDTGILYGGVKYNLSSFFTFTLTTSSKVDFDAYPTQCGSPLLVRIFKQGITNNCADLDTANILSTYLRNNSFDCLPPGDYTVQVSGQDVTAGYNYFTYNIPSYNSEQCLSTNLGSSFRFSANVFTRNPSNKYSLNAAGVIDTINNVAGVMQTLQPNMSYGSRADTMGCLNTVLPADTNCAPGNGKAIYRKLAVADSGVLGFSDLTIAYNASWRYRLYTGDADALATAQNMFAFPDKINGLLPKTLCMDGYFYCNNKTVCVTPGTYTFVTMGGDADVGRADRPTFSFAIPKTLHNSPLAAQDMGSIMDTLGPAGGTVKSDVDVWDCYDNAVPINGYEPCTINGSPATKAIYRQFYLKEDALVYFSVPYYWYCANRAYGYKTLFYGKATDGAAGLTPVGGSYNCFGNAAGTTAGCNLLPAGWYTLVSYQQGPSYDSVFRHTNIGAGYNGAVSYYDEFNITITPTCPGPKYNRPYKASVNTSNQPHDILLVNRTGHTPAFPRTDTTYVLPTERFNCTLDTPFASHPVVSCENTMNRVAYYVFKTTEECFLYVHTTGYYTSLYNMDVRTDSLQLTTLKPMQPCDYRAGYFQYCYFQPGTYTLVVFAGDNAVCNAVTPFIYVDRIGYSRFDFAKKAYDFGVVPADSLFHYGKTGDVNPLNPLRQPSSDFFYCTTGADSSNPTDPVCGTKINPNVYNFGPNKPLYDSVFTTSNGVARRNLWYTFVVDQPGTVRVRVDNKSDNKGYQPKFAIYRSNVDGTLPFSTVLSSGQIDSTTDQGLSIIGVNPIIYWPYACASTSHEISFYRDPCTSITNRYYVLVENVNSDPWSNGGNLPNTQIEVSVMIDSVNLILPKHDHYYQAGDLGSSLGAGVYTGDTDNYSCATRDATDPEPYNCQKTLWYKFTAGITGNVRYRVRINGVVNYGSYHVQLFRQFISGDSTGAGMIRGGEAVVYDPATNSYWAQSCVSPGTYYMLITGCAQLNAYVYPEIELIEAAGDFCSRAIPAAVNGAVSVSATVQVDCHTIGTDYGEFGPQLTCPPGAVTNQYKTSWFRMDIGGTDTLDVTAFLVENTNASSSDIKYRMMTGDCGAMQEQSCVLDALTQNTYQCLAPGQSYYIQVFTPVTKQNQQVTGTIDLRLSAVAHTDTCAPLTNCLSNANFTPLFNCTMDELVKLVNYSTYGTSINYKWYFGYNNQTSTEVSPYFFYPALPTDSTYNIKLVVENISCGKKDSITKPFTVPARPFINFGNDISSCGGSPVTLVATSHPGATYTWSNNTTDDSLIVSSTGSNNYWVKIDYNGCTSTDTVRVVISNITPRPVQNIILCSDSVSINASRGQGETYRWNTGAATASIFASTPGVYWADVIYFTCTYRDSFMVNNVSTARPLGSDTTACLSGAGYILRATTTGAQSYVWQNGSSADTFRVTAPGQYNVAISFGNCTVNDTVNVSGYPAPVSINRDTVICQGRSLTLPWGTVVSTAGIYRDTIRYSSGCDSLIRRITVTINPKPALGADRVSCLPQNPVTINGTTPGAVSYQWQDGSTSNSFTVTAPGTYWVQANFATCSTRDSITVSSPAPPVTISSDTAVCSGLSVTLPWGNTVNIAGSYRDTISNILGCDSVILVVNVTIKTKPVLGNNSTASICRGNFYNLTTSYNTTGLTTAWTINNVAVVTPSTVTDAGIYQLIATNSNGCADTALLTLAYHPKPALGNDNTASICSGNSFNLTSLYNTAGLTADWTINNITVANTAAVSVQGIYQLIVTNTQGCKDTALVTLTVNSKPAIGNDTTINICRADVVDLTTLYNTTALTAAWSFNSINVTNPSAVIDSGTYRLIVINSNGCSDTAFVNIRYYPKPVLGNDMTVSFCQGNDFNLTTAFNTAGLITAWTINNVAVVTPSTVTDAGIYQLIATNSNGCADTALLTLSYHPKPALGNDNTASICSGNSFNLTSLYSTAGLTADWTINNITVANTAAVSVQGVYQLIVTNTQGCKDTALVTLTVNSKPAIGNDNTVTICEGRTTDLAALYNTTGLIAVWTINGNLVTNPAAVANGGTYQLIASTVQGCSDTALVTVTVNPKPILGNDRTENICAGNSIDLTTLFATGSNNNTWTLNSAAVNNPGSITTAGSYQLVTATPQGCSDTALAIINIVNAPVVVTNTQGPICSPQTFDLTAAAITAGSATGLTFTYWLDAGATQHLLAQGTETAVTSGTYYIKGTDAFGCFSIAPVTLNYYPLPVVDAGDDVAICNNDSTTLTAVASNTPVPVTYQWSPVNEGGIRSPAAATTMVVPSATQEYVVTIIDGYGCNYAVRDSILVTMQPPVKAFAGNDTIAPTGLPHQLLATGGINYAWQPSGFLNNSLIANPLATIYADSILFTVIVRDAAGCVGYDTVKVRTYDGITYYVPNAFSPNGDLKNDIFRPIPVGVVTTEYFRVFNRYGQVMFETNQYLKGWDGTYKGVPQPVGNYVWVVKGKARSGKVIEMKGNVVLVR
jgi:gliding motility-associated-like protein